MKIYADYEFYRNTYQGKLAEENFGGLAIRATQYIRYVTLNRSDQYEGDELKYAMCEVADIYARSDEKSGRTVLSENVDGYSISYAAEGAAGETTEHTWDKKAYQVLRKWLLQTGLLNRRVNL